MKLLVHRGTGTVINLDDDVFVIETDNLTDQENDIIESGSDSGIAEVAYRAGTPISWWVTEQVYAPAPTEGDAK